MDDNEFFFDPNMPEELKEQIKSAHYRAEMEYDDVVHALYRMVEEIDVEHLKTLKVLIHGISDNPQALGFWEGVFSSTIARRENVCPACGKDHDAALAAMGANGNDLAARSAVLIEMAEYHVEPLDDNDLTGLVVCTGVIPDQGPCGLQYASFEDRKARAPGDCHGCFMKSSQG